MSADPQGSSSPSKWLVTGAAGFIGSHLVEALLLDGHTVVGLDNLSSGKLSNLEEVRARVGDRAWSRFEWVLGDIADLATLRRVAAGCEVVLHEAALGSVPLSIEWPLETHTSNATGFLNVLEAARTHGIRRVVYASSSAVYGNCPELPLRESSAGDVLSPYAASKLADEVYARAYAASYGLELVGLRYFNVFGPRQDPAGAYAAVIPRWIHALVLGEPVVINGDGNQTRDFCFVGDVVAANLKAAAVSLGPGCSLALNVGGGRRISLNELFAILAGMVPSAHAASAPPQPVHGPPRPGDILHSMADASAAAEKIGFRAESPLEDSLRSTFEWFARSSARPAG